MIVLGGEEDVEVEEKEDGAEAVSHFTSNILLNNLDRTLEDSTEHTVLTLETQRYVLFQETISHLSETSLY